MAGEYTQGDMAECCAPLRSDGHSTELDMALELRAKGRGLRRILGYPIATFPARFTTRVWCGNASPIDRRRDLASALREVADTLDAEAEDLQ